MGGHVDETIHDCCCSCSRNRNKSKVVTIKKLPPFVVRDLDEIRLLLDKIKERVYSIERMGASDRVY